MNSRLNAKITLAALATLQVTAVQLALEDDSETGVCECLLQHGQEVFFPMEGSPFILYTKDDVDYEYPANYGLGMCAAWDEGLEPDCDEN